MQHRLIVLVFVGVFMTGSTSVALAQQGEGQLRLVEEVHVEPGMVTEAETFIKDRAARMAQGNVTFAYRVAVGDSGIYRFETLLDNDYASLDRRREQLNAMPRAESGGGARRGIRGIDRSITQARPELSYIPDNPRLQPSEFGFLREIRLYLKSGAGNEVAGLLEKLSELNSARNTRGYRFVSSAVIGQGPQILVRIPARDAVDFYTQSARNEESPNEESQALIRQISELCERVEFVNYTIRRDLGYQPSN